MATAAEVHLRPELWPEPQEDQNLTNVLGTDGLDWGDADANQIVQRAIESTLYAGGMRSILPPPLPAPQWDELPFGVQWLIFKTVMEEKRSFTATAMCILRLSHQQIWTFVENYIAEWTSIHESRKKPAAAWSQQVLTLTAQNPNQMMRKQTLPMRPQHAIDRLTSDDLRSGEAYLKRAGLVKAAALVRDWQTSIELNPLKLKIDNHILQRVQDLRLVNFAITKGWVSREQVDTQLVADCSIGAMSSSRWHENEPIDEMFTTFTRSDIRSHTGQQAGATISPPANGTAPVPTGGGQFLESPSQLPQRVTPVNRPTDRVSAELSTAIRRISQQVPYEHVSGWLVRTCVEAGEAPCKPTSATAVAQEGATQHPPAAKQGKHYQSPGSTKTGTFDVVATSAGTGVAQEQQTRDDPSHASKNSARAEPERKNGTTDLTGQMPSPGMETDAIGSQHRRAAIPPEYGEAPPRFAPRRQHSEAQQVTLPAAAPEPTPSETLRKLLKTRWAKYLKDEDDQPPEVQVAKPKKKKPERDLPFEDDMDIGKIPEDDDDDDYIPGVNTHPKHAVPKGPKGVTTPTVQHSSSPRKGSAGPRIMLKRKEALGTPSPAGARFTSGSHCHVDAKRRAQSHRAPEHSEATGCPSNKRRKLDQGGNGNGNAVINTVHEALPRQSDTLFGGVLRHEVLPSIEGNAQRARFAWSADHAHYAGVATLAKQSYHADRLSMTTEAIQYRSSLWERGRLENQETMRSSKAMRELGKLKALKGELEIAEEANKGVRTGPAENAKLAGCADTAAYAWQATEAYLAVVLGGNQVDPET